MDANTSATRDWAAALSGLAGCDEYILFETGLPGVGGCESYLFTGAVETVEARLPQEVIPALERIEEGVRGGLYAAGIFSYELGCCLEEGLFEPPAPHSLPLLGVGLFRSPEVFPAGAGREMAGSPGAFAWDFRLSETPEAYRRNIGEIKRRIEQGHTYQVNYTLRVRFSTAGDPLGLYMHLRDRQKVAYGGVWRSGGQSVLSFSPELFFRLNEGKIETRPMKGTAPRGADAGGDAELRDFLRNDEKNRAENVMIVDLLRNDLGRVSVAGSVQVPSLFEVEPYETLFQMTSTVVSTVEPDSTLTRLLVSLFPSGSVTGAPKISSMKIIRELEGGPRGIYTGSLGFIAPQMARAVFNVAIRTLHIDGAAGEMGIGGGIVYDSSAESEWREALLKGNFFTGSAPRALPPGFALIETLLYTPGEGLFLLDFHIDRLEKSAAQFGIPLDAAGVRDSLDEVVNSQQCGGGPLRVRLLADAAGRVSVECAAFTPPAPDAVHTVVFCPEPVLSSNPFLRHKTTLRNFYNEMHAKYAAMGHADVIFTNERGEVTEGAITNVAARIGGGLVTPPAECGLLEGVYRRHLIETGRAREGILTPDALASADELFIFNSVRGMMKAELRPV